MHSQAIAPFTAEYLRYWLIWTNRWKLRGFETVNLSIQLRYFMVTWITYLNILVAKEKLKGSTNPIQRPYLFHTPQRNHGVNPVMIPQLHQRMLHRKYIPHQKRWDSHTSKMCYIMSNPEVSCFDQKHITFRHRTYKFIHKFVKHGFQTKIIKNSTIFVHCIGSHDSKFGFMDPLFKILNLNRKPDV